MRNDAFDELDDVPSLTTDAADRDEFGHHPRHVYEPEQRRVVDTKERRPASTGPLWALLGAMLIALAGVGWWSHQQISLMEQQLVATQESFVRISEEAAGRLDDIRGKVVASESSVTSEREALRLQVKQLQEKLGSQERQQADVSNQFGGQEPGGEAEIATFWPAISRPSRKARRNWSRYWTASCRHWPPNRRS